MIKLVSTQFFRRSKVYKHYFDFPSPEKFAGQKCDHEIESFKLINLHLLQNALKIFDHEIESLNNALKTKTHSIS